MHTVHVHHNREDIQRDGEAHEVEWPNVQLARKGIGEGSTSLLCIQVFVDHRLRNEHCMFYSNSLVENYITDSGLFSLYNTLSTYNAVDRAIRFHQDH